MITGLTGSAFAPHNAEDPEPRLRKAAQDLEANFLREMLKSAGLNATESGFGGGIGEDQFASFLTEAQAQEIARAGGIGLAETIFDALKERMNETFDHG